MMVEEYMAFADVYDEFMDNVDYAAWGKRIIEILKKHGIDNGLVLDLGCGTGTLTEILSNAGYDMTGVDASDAMLQKALAKRDKSASDILYLCQDMRGFELYGTMAAIVCVCDSLNYITDKRELLKVFRLVNNYLDPKGLFVFDFNTPVKYEKIGDASIAETRDDAAFVWENHYNKKNALNEYLLTLFVRAEGDDYKRHEEYHAQRGYTLDEIKSLLERAGLVFDGAFDGYTTRKATAKSERVVVVTHESGKQTQI